MTETMERPDVGDPGPGDPDGWFRGVYDEHWAAMVRLAALLLGSSDHAEEVVQEAMIGLHRHRHRLTDGPVGGYLRTAVVNGCRSVQRHRAVVTKHWQPPEPAMAGPEDQVLSAVAASGVVQALRSLPQRQQEVLVLRYYEHLDGAEIAEALGISRGAVKSHTHRAMAALRAGLSERNES